MSLTSIDIQDPQPDTDGSTVGGLDEPGEGGSAFAAKQLGPI